VVIENLLLRWVGAEAREGHAAMLPPAADSPDAGGVLSDGCSPSEEAHPR
jgi:hypothetical protein